MMSSSSSPSESDWQAKGLGFRVWGLGFGVWGLGFGVWGLGFRVWVHDSWLVGRWAMGLGGLGPETCGGLCFTAYGRVR